MFASLGSIVHTLGFGGSDVSGDGERKMWKPESRKLLAKCTRISHPKYASLACDYFELKAVENQQMQESSKIGSKFSFCKGL